MKVTATFARCTMAASWLFKHPGKQPWLFKPPPAHARCATSRMPTAHLPHQTRARAARPAAWPPLHQGWAAAALRPGQLGRPAVEGEGVVRLGGEVTRQAQSDQKEMPATNNLRTPPALAQPPDNTSRPHLLRGAQHVAWGHGASGQQGGGGQQVAQRVADARLCKEAKTEAACISKVCLCGPQQQSSN